MGEEVLSAQRNSLRREKTDTKRIALFFPDVIECGSFLLHHIQHLICTG